MALFPASGIDEVAACRRQTPRLLLICCEGKTEEAYFNILLDYFRPSASVEVKVYGQKGQHFALIDNAVLMREEICEKEGLTEKDLVECWAVCDEDKMPCNYSNLLQYANNHDVHLAFSAPQFEMYLLQHFEQSGDSDKLTVFEKLGTYRERYGFSGGYHKRDKADLEWLSVAIDRRPKLVKTAIVNSEVRDRATKRPFLTVQRLVKRILDLSI